jgi:hypothetical protein
MELLPTETVQKHLLAEYAASGFRFDECNMADSSSSEEDIHRLEERLKHKVPSDFSEMLLRYNFGRVEIAHIFFGHMPDYVSFLISTNTDVQFPRFPWWGGGERPDSLILIAYTEAYSLLMDLNNSAVEGGLKAEGWGDRKRISLTFELLVRGAGTLHLLRDDADDLQNLGNEVALACGADRANTFWQEVAQGFA